MVKYHVRVMFQRRLFNEFFECGNCNNRVSKNDDYCGKCGEKFDLLIQEEERQVK